MEYLRLYLEHLAWINHQFMSGRRDSRKAGSLRGMMGSVGGVKKLLAQIKIFMDKDRHVSIETISALFDVNVGNVHSIIREELKMRKICTKFVPKVLREDQKERCCHGSREMVKLINSDPSVLDALATCNERWIYTYDPETNRQISQWKHACSPRPKKARQSKSTHKLLMIPFFDSTGMIYMHWVPTGQNVNKEYYVEVLREFRKRFLGKRPAFFKSGQWHFRQDNALVHNSILVTDYLTKMGIKKVHQPPIVQTLLPVIFGYFLRSRKTFEAVVMRQLRRWKRLWRRSLTRSHKRTSMGPSRSCWNGTTIALQPSEITSKGTRVSCEYYQ